MAIHKMTVLIVEWSDDDSQPQTAPTTAPSLPPIARKIGDMVALFTVPFILSTILALLLMAISSCGVSTGIINDPLLIASGPTAPAVLAVAGAIGGADRRAIDCDPLVSTGAGILMCSLLVSCALPLEDHLTFGGIEFPGDVGIARGWARGGITIPQRQAVTACVLANLSQDGLVAVVSMRGLHLEVLPEELAEWTEEEGAFFGDLMAPVPIAGACQGEADPALSMRHNRLCALPDPDHPGFTLCGLAFAGPCSRACSELPWGARDATGRRCRLKRNEFTRVITTFEEP